MSEQITYEEARQYLRAFSTQAPPTGFSDLLQLVLTGIENLRKNVPEGGILENAHFITDAQASFLKQLLETRAESIAVFINDITHQSQTGQL